MRPESFCPSCSASESVEVARVCVNHWQDLIVTFEMIVFAIMQLRAFSYKGTMTRTA